MNNSIQPFVKATEIWAPQRDAMVLEFVNGQYGELNAFRRVSEYTQFAYDQGLPGKAWAAGHPLILNDLQNSYFARKEAALAAGISTAIALPIFAGQCLTSVVVFLCGDDETSVGAIELWHCDTDQSHDLDLEAGYFGRLEHFEFISRHTSFRKGTGLPGRVWETGMPELISDLGQSHRFIRSQGAVEAGMTTGLGIPVFFRERHIYIMAFLSAKGTPIARQIELWVPDADHQTLRFERGYSDRGRDLQQQYHGQRLTKGEGILGRTFLTGVPAMSLDGREISDGAQPRADAMPPLASVLAIPILRNGWCQCVVALYA